MRILQAVIWLLAVSLSAATLEKLSLEEMTLKSTAIVRGRATGSRTAVRGPVIYTLYQVQVAEQWKGPAASQVEVAVPGGDKSGLRQTFSGAPKLQEGVDYVLFLWTGRNGLTQVIGLSQGKFELSKDKQGDTTVSRTASSETMLDSEGQAVADAPVRLSLKSLDQQIRRTLAVSK
jgi:hypothetical protein